MSGSGKSTIAEQLKRDIIINNPKQKIKFLSFEFEMLAQDQIIRNISGNTGYEVKQLLSAAEEKLEQSKLKEAIEAAKKLIPMPIYYVETVGSVPQIVETILESQSAHKMVENGEGLIVTIDHVLLTKGRTGEDEKTKIVNLMHALVATKKYLSTIGLNVSFIVLSQLNRDIERPERIINSSLHFPNRNDIFASSSIFYSSDYVLITHKPAGIDGIGNYYGPARRGYPKGLPVYNPSDSDQAMIYWHLIKERFGKPKILSMVDDFAKSRVSEINLA